MTTLHLTKSIGRSHLRLGFFLPALALVCFALVPRAQAVVPAPDGGYAGGNTAEGENALLSLTSGTYNTAVGLSSLGSNTQGRLNTAIGAATLFANTGDQNTATGAAALFSNTTGGSNTASGFGALFSNTTGSDNTANGFGALYSNTTGYDNTANGEQALYFNTTGSANTANGLQALRFNTTGSYNTANGFGALYSNTYGTDNTANGYEALLSNTGGYYNTANGLWALYSNTTGSANTANGYLALYSNTIGYANTAIGHQAGDNLTIGNFNIDIGAFVYGNAGEFNTIRIGTQGTQSATFIAGISGATASGGAAVYVNSNGQLGTATSSRRFKQDINPMDKASEAILSLRPVTFRYKQEIDPKGIPQFGLVAEDVEKVNPALVVRDAEGKAYSVRYEAVNAMLLNEFLKEHRKVEQQEATITQVKTTTAKQEATIAKQQKQIEALTTGLQKVSAQVEMSRRAPQIVDNHQ